MQPRPVMLVILDGFGWREEAADNAVAQAKKPNFDRLWQAGPHAFLHTSGRDFADRLQLSRARDFQVRRHEASPLVVGPGSVRTAGWQQCWGYEEKEGLLF